MLKKLIFTLVTLSIANLLGGISFWLSSYNYFADILDLKKAILFSVSFSFYLATLSLSAIVCRKWQEFFLCGFPIIIPTLIIVRPFELSLLAFLSLLITGLLLFLTIRKDKMVYLKISVGRLLQGNVGTPFLLLALVCSLVYYESSRESLLSYQFKVPEKLIEQSVNLALKISGTGDLNSMKDTAIEEGSDVITKNDPFITSILESQGITSKEDQEKMLLEIEKYLPLGGTSNENEVGIDELKKNVTRSLKEEVAKQLEYEIDKYRIYFPIIFSVSFFLTLIFIGSIIKGLTLAVGVLSFQLFLILGLIRIVSTTREGTELAYAE